MALLLYILLRRIYLSTSYAVSISISTLYYLYINSILSLWQQADTFKISPRNLKDTRIHVQPILQHNNISPMALSNHYGNKTRIHSKRKTWQRGSLSRQRGRTCAHQPRACESARYRYPESSLGIVCRYRTPLFPYVRCRQNWYGISCPSQKILSLPAFPQHQQRLLHPRGQHRLSPRHHQPRHRCTGRYYLCENPDNR